MNRKQPQRRTGYLLTCAVAALALPLSAMAYDGNTEDKTVQERTAEMMERAGDAASDMRIHLAVEAEFARSDELSAFTIGTDVSDGVVRLDGEVESSTERELAGELAKSVDGVKEVDNRIDVMGDDPGFIDRIQSAVTDAALTAHVNTRLLASENTSGLEISVASDGNVVTLSGEVESDAERDLAELIARNTSGVEDVHNRIEVSNNGY